ncbi:MAG: M1 family metallopeptidase [Planctomycetes bacterium]|nr:M1 family metallopeptidase [Planctomycetota bacterium]
MMASRILGGLGFAAFFGLGLAGCATPIAGIHAETYDLRLAIAPQQNRLTATARMHCRLIDGQTDDPQNRLSFDLALHPNLEITDIRCDDSAIHRVQKLPSSKDDESPSVRLHRITLDEPINEFDLIVSYTGTLQQDISAGEKRGEIHNFAVSAHIGTNGIYLGSGAWFPQFDRGEDVGGSDGLSRYRVRLEPVAGYKFVCSASRLDRSQPNVDGAEFESDFPQTGLALVGGRYERWTRDVDGVHLAILLNPSNTDQKTLEHRADVFLTAAGDYLRRYQPLVGPYPYDDFTIVENFFSSGFAFPTFTLLGPVVIAMEERALRHGYVDHELLHSWWGNGVYVDDSGGNWCEALASFGANLYGYTLDGDAGGERKTRRDACNILTRISKKNDKPLATFGRPDGAGRSIGYQKGAIVFDMLAREIGVENFWKAMRELTAEHTGKFAGWDTFRKVFEDASGTNLEPFFAQWIYGGNAPRFTLARSWIDTDSGVVGVEIEQDDPLFTANLPLRVHNADGSTKDIVVPVADRLTRVTIDDVLLPVEVELDPDYHVARKLSGDEILPTLASSARGDCAVLVYDDGDDAWPGYGVFAKDITDNRKPGTTQQTATPDADALSQCTVVIIGETVRHPLVQPLLERSECPIRWLETGFEIDGKVYASNRESVLCTFRHPDAPGKTITVYFGNSPEALSNAGILWFYGNSLLVYRSIAGKTAEVVLRRDLERTQRLKIIGNEAQARAL